MKTMYIYSQRYSQHLISKEAPLWLKEEYKAAIGLEDYSEVDIDKEDWIESIIQLTELVKFIPKNQILIYNDYKKISYELEAFNDKFKDIKLIGLYVNFKRLDFIKLKYKINKILFPFEKEAIDLEWSFMKNDFFKKYANRNLLGFASTVDPESGDILKERKLDKWKERLIDFNYCKKTSVEVKLKELAMEIKKPTKFFIKTRKKHWAVSILLEPNNTHGEIYSKLMDLFGYSWSERIFNERDNIFVQEYADIEYEYRFIIINGKIVTGGGSIEEFTPAQNKSIFDIQLRKDRKGKSEIIEAKSIVSNYLKFAKNILKEIKYKNYTLDIAFINGKIGIIELNPYLNVGFFASNYKEIIKEIKEI